ncbi:S8 family serine peptidase [Paenibacillus sp. GCM10012307]|uniref:S8 family serine peptidase n=1 Tax=Paenibacillus roseus TaxID=2798579 RepID=A0A934MKJ7_9BACL|nr:S8 family serine peptidase [Paenibacillus roseus]MBJ6361120.1 S8 family serine peptidase [Paenibacillus roseus]
MKKLFAVLIVLSVLLLDINTLFAIKGNYYNGSAENEFEEVSLPTIQDTPPKLKKDVVTDLLSQISISNSMQSNKPQGKFIIRFKQEFNVDEFLPLYEGGDLIEGSSEDSDFKALDEETAFNLADRDSLYTEKELNAVSLEYDMDFKQSYYHVQKLSLLNGISISLNVDEVNHLLRNPTVESIEEDKPIEIAKTSLTDVSSQELKESSQTIPWGIHSTGSYLVHSLEQAAGNAVKVAVFDTGIASHPDLHIAGGVSFVSSEADYEDQNGHGTHIAGTIAALDNAIGVVGVAPQSNLYSVQVIDAAGDGYTSSVLQGIDWAIENNIDIINMSFIASQYSDALHTAIQQAQAAGILIIAAAGNVGAGENTVQYPAKYPDVVAVGALDSSHHRLDFSSTGQELDLMAPGFGIISTSLNGEYGVSAGTSTAAAHVTGAAALLRAKYPLWTNNEIVQKLKDTATPLGDAHEYGAGLINVAKAMDLIPGPIAPLSDENLSGLSPIWPPTNADITLASYDKVNNGATITSGSSVTVSLKLEGDQNGQNPHSQIIVEVYPAANPSNIIATKTISNPKLHVAIPYTWQTSSNTPTGTYHIKYRYPSLGTGNFDDIFVIYVSQPGSGPDTYEPNDTFLTAYSVNPGNSYISYISSASDIDYYKFSANATGEVTVNLTIPSTVDYDLYLYNASGAQIAQSESGTGIAERITVQVLKDNMYYIKVIGHSGQYSTLPYTLTISNIQVPLFPAPTGLEVVSYATSIKLSWDPSPGATSYRLQINGAVVATSTNTSYTFTGLSPLSNYKLGVAAVYAGGTSSYSEIQTSTTIPELIVYQPEDMDLVAGLNQLYTFKPATTGIYRIYTGRHGGTGAVVDTELFIYSNLQLTKLVDYNDDTIDSVFSQVEVSLIGGQTYYVKVAGYGSARLRARITAEVVSSSIPYIQLDRAVNINQLANNSSVYVFVPPANGQYRIATSPYNGNLNLKPNDTELFVYPNADMETTITNGYNDDKKDSVYSEVVVNLSVGIPYYVRVKTSDGSKIYARLLVSSAGPTGFTALQSGVSVDLLKPRGEEAYYQFTPSASGKYRFFTSNYQRTLQLNDTEIELYSDIGLRNLIDFNDDVKGYKPYGELFSKLEVNLNAGTTYYLVIRGSISSDLKARFTVEDMRQSDIATARSIELNQLIDTDLSGSPTKITSLYDVDYYRIQLNQPRQVSLYLSEGEGAIEDASGNIRGYFSMQGDMSFDLQAGVYYLRVQKYALLDNTRAPAWSFQSFNYELSADLNEIEYVPGSYDEENSFFRSLAAGLPQAFDATPMTGGNARITYNNKKSHSKLQVEVFTSSGISIYKQVISGNYTAGRGTQINWYGSVDPSVINKQLFAQYAYFPVFNDVKYWAKSGSYDIVVSRLDGTKKKDSQSTRVKVFNDPLNVLNIVPLPPSVNDKGKEIKENDIYSCEKCINYFERYIYSPSNSAPPLTAYTAWFQSMYGYTKLAKFWKGAERLVLCNESGVLANFQCTLDTIGMIPILGESADAVNGVIYLINGEYANALLSVGAIIPIAGNGFTGAKKFTKIYKFNPCGCLPAGTIIKTKNGDKPIEEIKVGDLVLAKDTDTGIQSYKPVEELFNNETDEVYTINVSNTSIQTTSNHPFWVKGKGWVPADELIQGDELETEDGTLHRINSISLQYEPTNVYNFTVREFHSYYISNLGILTHNLTDACQISKYSNLSTTRQTDIKSSRKSVILEAEIKKATKMDKPSGWQAHHIAPASDGRFKSARDIQKILDDLKIDINSSSNGVYLPTDKGKSMTVIDGQTVATHNGGHAESYYQFVLDRIEPVKNNKDLVVKELNYVRKELLEGRLKIGNLSN